MRERKSMTESAVTQERYKRYHAFWRSAPVERPLIGFSVGGWFPFQHYTAMQQFSGLARLKAEDLHPEEFFADYDRLVGTFGQVKDDVIRAVSPLPFLPWLEAMLGAPVEVSQESVWAREGGFDFADVDPLDFSPENPWRRTYLAFVAALTERYRSRVPIGLPILRGVSDLIACLRGSQQMIFDLYDQPDEVKSLARKCTNFIIGLVQDQHKIAGPFAGGYMIDAYTLWAPDKIMRIQEDASALFSPDLYDEFLRKENEIQASALPYSLVHLHSSSLHLLDRILDVEPMNCIQINKDAGGTEIEWELPYFKRVQNRGRRLLIRGKLSRGDLALLRQNLSARGLFVQSVVETPEETEALQEFFEPWG
jgi:hypothetical protein